LSRAAEAEKTANAINAENNAIGSKYEEYDRLRLKIEAEVS
jgi:hypothetical protein